MFSLFSHLLKLFGAKPGADEATDATETESIETTQTDASYSKEVEHEQPIPAPTWTLPLCGPLLNRLLPKNGTRNVATNCNYTKDDSSSCASTIYEKDDFVCVNPPTESADAIQPKPNPLCAPRTAPDETGRRHFEWDFPVAIDNIINPMEIAFIADLLEKLRDGVAKDAPIKHSTLRLAPLIRTRVARWADGVIKEVDKEMAKVERIWRQAEGGEEDVDGKEVGDKEVD
ncbi:hypothetical protein N0V85_000738 [Neurospora sp. IMI 360204]|nr:hypothetical protein N0V85_000738 [Neurospora sp. IMI 360204]